MKKSSCTACGRPRKRPGLCSTCDPRQGRKAAPGSLAVNAPTAKLLHGIEAVLNAC